MFLNISARQTLPLATLALLALLLSLGGGSFASAADLININTADATALDTLPGIGSSKAAAIIEYRETNGDFAVIADIQNVSGIGPETFADIEPYITVRGGASSVSEDNEESDADESKDDSDAAGGSSSNEPPDKPVSKIRIIAPRAVVVNQPVEFRATPDEGRDGRLIRYRWNFGDGQTARGTTPIHAYATPGRYVVVVESYFLKETHVVRHEVTVREASLSLSRTVAGDVVLTNDAPYEVDASGFSVGSMTLPPHTIILSGASITVPREHVAGERGAIALTDAGGLMIAALAPKSEAVGGVRSAHAASGAAAAAAAPTPTPPTPRISATSTVIDESPPLAKAASPETQTAASAASDTPTSNPLPYLALLGVIVAGIAGIYVRS